MADTVFTSPSHVMLPFGTLPKDVVDLGTVFGPFFLAQCFNWALYGALTLQVYIYWLRFPKDLTYIKWLVGVVFVLDTFSIALVTHAAWRVLVSYWGDVNILHELDWTWASVPVSSGVVSGIVQMFFVWRIWKLSQSFLMPFIITLVILAQAAFAIKTGFIAYETKTFHYIRDFLPAFWLGGSMLADILISVTLGRILWAGRTGFTDTDGVIMRLIRLTIEAAAVPALAAGIKLALIYTAHDNKHLVFCIVLARLYSNSLLAMLNCRDPLFGGGSKPNTMAGAARLSESGNSSFLRHIADKFSIRSRGANTSQNQAESRMSNGSQFLDHTFNDKIIVRQQTVRHGQRDIDIDLERGVELEYRSSQISLDDMSPMDYIKHNSAEFPITPTTPHSGTPMWGRQPDTDESDDSDTGKTYDTRSQFPPPFLPDGTPVPAPSPSQLLLSARPTLTKPEPSYTGRRAFD